MPRLPSQLTYNDLNGSEATEILCDWFRQLLTSQPQFQPHLTLPNAKFSLNVSVAVDMYVGGTVPVASPPERLTIAGRVSLENSTDDAGGPAQHTEVDLAASVNVSPTAGGEPPDKVREKHDLPIPSPGYGPRETGSHLFLADQLAPPSKFAQHRPAPPDPLEATGGRDGIVAEGYVFSGQRVDPRQSGPLQQTIPVDKGSIQLDNSGNAIRHESGMTVTAGTHVASKKTAGDQAGAAYGSVNGVYDPGPAGLANHGGGSRPRISFGNSNRG
jgi:hypothetical protein